MAVSGLPLSVPSPPSPVIFVLKTLRKTHAAPALVAVFLLAAGCGLPLGEAKTRDAPTPERPNAVLILTDDMRKDDLRYMPKTKALLAEEGVTFEDAFVTDPLCCPSRATILRGQYAHNIKILSNEPPLGGHEKLRALGLDRSTVATRLKSAGYRTVLVGKYLNGYEGTYVPLGWEEWYGISGSYLSNRLNDNGRIVRYDPERYHFDDVLAAKAAGYVRRSAANDRPFFMWLGTKAPHQPATPAPRHESEFLSASLPRPPSFDEEDVSDKPAWIRDNPPLSQGRGFTGTAQPLQANSKYMEELYRKRLRSLLAVDDMIGRLVTTLRQRGELRNTYVFFTSDNGFHMGEHRLGAGNWTAYEEDIRVPLVVRGPGVPEGRTLEHLALNNDLAPTFADLAGVEAPSFVDGRSLKPLLEEDPPPEEDWRQAFLVEAAAESAGASGPPFTDESPVKPLLTGDPLPEDRRRSVPGEAKPREDFGRPGLKAIKTEDYLYVEYETGERELYDLEEDPYQLNNGYENADPALLRQLEGRLKALRGCAGVECRTLEDDHRPRIIGTEGG